MRIPIETRYGIDDEENCIFVERSGQFHSGSIIKLVEDVIELPEYRRGMNFYIDVSQMEYGKAGYAELSPNRLKWEELAKLTGHLKIAFVDESGKNYGTGRQSGTLLSNEIIQQKPFKVVEEALTWLNIRSGYEVISQFIRRLSED